jgi:hypothetical protein
MCVGVFARHGKPILTYSAVQPVAAIPPKTSKVAKGKKALTRVRVNYFTSLTMLTCPLSLPALLPRGMSLDVCRSRHDII